MESEEGDLSPKRRNVPCCCECHSNAPFAVAASLSRKCCFLNIRENIAFREANLHPSNSRTDLLDLLLHLLVVALLLELLLQPHDGPRGVLRLLPQLVDLQLRLLADLGERRVQVRHLLVQAARRRHAHGLVLLEEEREKPIRSDMLMTGLVII